jgi:hypothetical protein
VPAERFFARLPPDLPAHQQEVVDALRELCDRVDPLFLDPRQTDGDRDADRLRLSIAHSGSDGGRIVVLAGDPGYVSVHWPGGDDHEPDRWPATVEALLTGRNRVVAQVVRGEVVAATTTLWDADGTRWKAKLRIRTPLFPPLMRKRSTISFEHPSLLGPAAKAP